MENHIKILRHFRTQTVIIQYDFPDSLLLISFSNILDLYKIKRCIAKQITRKSKPKELANMFIID